MRKNWMRIAAMGMCIVLAAGALAGCSRGNSNKNDVSKVEVGEDGGQDVSKEPVTIEWLAYNTYAQPDEDSEIVKQIEKKFNVKFEFWYVDDQKWDEVLGAKLSSGDMPDVMKIKNTANIPIYVKQGILAEITDEMLAKIPSFTKQVEEANVEGNGIIDAYYDGKMYALKTPSIPGTYPTVMVWRTDWLKNLGIEKIPASIDEMEEAMYAIRNNDPDGNGVKDTYGMSNTAMNAVFGAYGAIPLKEFRGTGTQNLFYTEKDGKIEFACTQPEMKEALAKIQNWYKEGFIDPEFITGENTAGYWATSQAFENGKVGVTGMAMGTHWMPAQEEGKKGGPCYEGFVAMNPEAKWEETVDIGPAIQGPEGKSGTHTWGGFSPVGFGITTKGAEDPRKVDAILAMIEAYSSDPEYALLASWGIEGIHYEKTEDGGVRRLEPFTKPSEYIQDGVAVFMLGSNTELDRSLSKKSFEFSDKYKTTGYQDILVPATEAANQYLTDLKTFTLDAYIKIMTGEESVDYFDTFVQEFNSMGGEQILNEINAEIAKN